MRSPWAIVILAGQIPAIAVLAVAILIPTALSPPLTVQITSEKFQNGSIAVTIQLTSHRATFLAATATEVTGRVAPNPSRPIFYVYDPTFPVYFGSKTDVVAQLQRIDSQMTLYGDTTPIREVSFSALPSVLANNSDAIVVDLESGLLPGAMLSPNSTSFSAWLANGGTLVWAGGPLGFYQAVITKTANSVTVGGWTAQSSLLGYPLVDPTGNNTSRYPVGEPGPVAGSSLSPVGAGLETSYWGVPYGANTSLLEDHLGVDLGWDTGGARPRTSLAVLPYGLGTIFYFGGGLGPSGGPMIPDGGYSLAIDVARLIGCNFIPTGPVVPAIAHPDISPFGSVAVTFFRPSSGPPSAIIVQLTVGRDPSFFGLWPLTSTGTLPGETPDGWSPMEQYLGDIDQAKSRDP